MCKVVAAPTYPICSNDARGSHTAQHCRHKRPRPRPRSRHQQITNNTRDNRHNTTQRRHGAKHRVQRRRRPRLTPILAAHLFHLDRDAVLLFIIARVPRHDMQPAVVVVGNHPGLKDAKQQRRADAAGEAAQEQHRQVVACHGEACQDVEAAVEQARALAAEAVGEGAGKGGADAARGETGGVEGGDDFFGEVLFVLVDGVDVRALFHTISIESFSY